MRLFPSFLRDAWALAKPYYQSEERTAAWILLICIVAMNLMLVGMDVVLNYWNGAFYDSLQSKDWNAFIHLLLFYKPSTDGFLGYMPGFCAIVAPYILIAIYKTYLTQWLEMRWRRWMTGHFLDRWLADRAYYRVSLLYGANGDVGTENPDQRIAEDLRDFVGGWSSQGILSLGLDLLSNVVSLFAFLHILWKLSGAAYVFGLVIPGYMLWVAILYALAGTIFAHFVGRALAKLNFQQQRYEADFRFGLMRLRENAEGVAIQNGENAERAALHGRFQHIVLNWWEIMRRTKALNALSSGYQQLANIFPILVAAPRYFSGKIPLGGLTRISSAFGQVQSALSWVVTSYGALMSWRATVERLASFDRALAAARQASAVGISMERGSDLALNALTLRLPDGRALLDRKTAILPAVPLVRLSGRSGAGKSTLLRAIAGIWPFGEGSVIRPEGRCLFVPQKPYLPLGRLRDVLAYPVIPETFTDADLQNALRSVGLPGLVASLDMDADWSKTLSGGEQQRVALARVLLLQPDFLFLDEATAHLERAAEDALLQMLRDKLPNVRIVMTTHRDLHEDFATFHPWPETDSCVPS